MGVWLKVAVLGTICFAGGLVAQRVLRRSPEPGAVAAPERPPRSHHRLQARQIEEVLDSRGEQQVAKVLSFVDRMDSGSDCLGFAKNLIADPDNRNSKTLWSLILARWSVVDPEGMITFVEGEKKSGRGNDLESMAWFAWAASDPSHLATQAPQLHGPLGLEVIRGLAAVDADLALEVAFKMPDANSAVGAALGASDKHDPERIRSLLARAVYDGMRMPMQRQLMTRLLQEDPRAAVAYAQRNGRIWSDPVAQVLGQAARDDPEEAVGLLEDLPSSRHRAISTVTVARNWAMNDPVGAVEWIRRQPAGEIRNTSLVAVASVIGGNDPRGGLALLEEVEWSKVGAFYSIGSVRESGSVYNQVKEHDTVNTLDVARNLLRSLAGTDPEEAREYVAKTVPPALRDELVKGIEE